MHWGTIVSHLLGYLTKNPAADEFVAWSILSAVILNMPVPGSPLNGRTLYEWLYNTLHQFANTGKQRPTPPDPSGPDGPKK